MRGLLWSLVGCVGLGSAMGWACSSAVARPNVVVILADDLGYSDLGCYGSEIATPNLDHLAANGLRFTQFYNTARCWPTRGALITGYYAQQIGMDPPRNPMPNWVRTLPQLLTHLGYRSYHSGKWHLHGLRRALVEGGFHHSYIVHDHNRYFAPRQHVLDDRPLAPVDPAAGYYVTTAIAEHAIGCLKEHAQQHPGVPFFQYIAFTSPHFPLHAPAEDVRRYLDHYRDGWQVVRSRRWDRQRELGWPPWPLSQPEPQIRAPSGTASDLEQLGSGEVAYAVAWTELTDEQKEFQATKMAIHAAMVHRMDFEIGRVLDQLRRMNVLDDTVIFFLSDNGASAEILVRGDGHDPAAAPGSAASFLCLGPGWSTVANTPFRRHKIWVHEGGIATGLIVHWPRGLAARGQWRHDLGHVIDLVPTILELAGQTPQPPTPAAPPLPGLSLVPAFAQDGALQREYLFFHHSGNRALRVGDWKIVSAADNQNRWELYNLAEDRTETHDLAADFPERVRQMASRWQALEDQFRRDAQISAAEE